MNNLFREDVKQVLADELLVERLPEHHWAKDALKPHIQLGVIRVEFYLKQRHMTGLEFFEILEEVEAQYEQRAAVSSDDGLLHRKNESGIPEERPTGSVHDQVTRVLEPDSGVLV